MNIKSDSIQGVVKKIYEYPNEAIQIIYYIYNYIEINNTYYLIDVSSTTGLCDNEKFIDKYSDFYFVHTLNFLFILIFQKIIHINFYLNI